MSDLRVRWAHVWPPDHPDAGRLTKNIRGHVVHWFQPHVGAKVAALVLRDDGSLIECSYDNLMADPEPAVADPALSVLQPADESAALDRLRKHIVDAGFAEIAPTENPADVAVQLLEMFAKELAEVGASRDAERARVEAAEKTAGELLARVEAAEKLLEESKPARRGGRNRGPETLG